ncbi:MAG: MarC family protein [Candidatus Altiarchaeota archaeon]|nr:MarC family protein [Candidatus Altiarchaeota archaeon]
MDDLTFFIQAFAAFFVVVDAIGNVPIFLTLLEGFNEADKAAMIRKATLIAFITVLVVTLTGKIIFDLLNVEMYSFRIAGGILLMIISIEMLFGRKSRTKTSDDMDENRQDLTVTPLAIPLLAGPGALTTGIMLFDRAESEPQIILLITSVLLVFLASYLVLAKAGRVFRFLGKTGTRVVMRVMGIMLLSIAVQFIIDGITEAAHAIA